jgi:hypothetical protein
MSLFGQNWQKLTLFDGGESGGLGGGSRSGDGAGGGSTDGTDYTNCFGGEWGDRDCRGGQGGV